MTDSPFLSKLYGDFIPGDEDVPLIKKIILQQSAKLSELALKVSEAKQRYDELLNQQSKLDKLIEGHRQLISPPRRNIVPVDIWREIFYHCLPDSHDAIMHPREAPSLLTQVCSTWRQITLSTPRLWSSIHIPIVDSLPLLPRDGTTESPNESLLWRNRSERRAKCITEWLTRSSSSPLSITLGDSSYIPYPDMAYEATQAHILLKAILPYSNNWNKLRIVVTKQRLEDLSKLNPSQILSLGTLDVENVITWEDPDEPSPTAKYAHRNLPLFLAPNLRRVSISQMMDDITSFPLPWHQLTHLSLSHNDYPKLSFEIVNLLKACPKIVEFRILTIVDPGPRIDANLAHLPALTHDHRGQITLPDFKVFEISGEGSSSDPRMFDTIATPTLETVSFFLPSQVGGSPLLPLARQANLTSLNTNSVLFVNDDFLLILRSCPSLKHLYISCTPNYYPESLPPIDRTDAFLKMLSTPDNNDSILCPLLEEMHITTGVTDFTDAGVLNFIKAKQAGKVDGLAKLHCLKISFPRYQTEPMVEELQPYMDDGLDLVLCYMEKFPELDGDAYRNIPFPSSGLLHHFDLSPNVKVF
ncbi:hypothetical protein CPB83DRAFT_859381 [Crepidotus variabilis]|uniref:F-box domain-containing protein n=1 Tax=Crepidotus variabilis TaxID=179855 RepID=A0A9P6EAS6_9AGAR|nr:hypothetical protein CPB83DRAFT_859381 [Crepidotus variabilis]